MHTGIAGSIVNKYLTVLIGNPSVGEQDIRHITDTFFADGSHEVSGRSGYDLGRVFQRSHVHIEYVAKTGSTTTHAMCQMQPSFGGLDGVRTFTVLHFLDGVVVAEVNNLFFLHFGAGHVVHQCPTDTTTTAGIDETVLRTSVEGILAIHKFRVEHYVPLLALGLQVRQTFPSNQILGAGDGCCSGGRGKVTCWSIVVMAFGTEDAINPAVFVGGEAHIVDVGSRNHILRHGNRVVPETEVVDAIGTLGHSKERFAVGSFYTDHQQVFSVPFDGSGIEGSIHADSFHEEWIGVFIQIVAPKYRSMGSGQDGVFVTGKDTITILNRLVGTGYKSFVVGEQLFHARFEFGIHG